MTKKKAIICGFLVVIILSVTLITGVNGKYVMSLTGNIKILTEEFYANALANSDEVITRNDTQELYIENLFLNNYAEEKYTKVPITYEITILDNNNSSDKFEFEYNGLKSENGLLTITLDDTTQKKDTNISLKIIENKEYDQYELYESITIKVKAISPYSKELLTKEIALDMKYYVDILLDYNRVSIANLSTITEPPSDNELL